MAFTFSLFATRMQQASLTLFSTPAIGGLDLSTNAAHLLQAALTCPPFSTRMPWVASTSTPFSTHLPQVVSIFPLFSTHLPSVAFTPQLLTCGLDFRTVYTDLLQVTFTSTTFTSQATFTFLMFTTNRLWAALERPLSLGRARSVQTSSLVYLIPSSRPAPQTLSIRIHLEKTRWRRLQAKNWYKDIKNTILSTQFSLLV